MLRKLFGSLILAGLLGVLVVGSAQSGGSAPKKFYAATGTPSSVGAGATYTQTITIANDRSSNTTLGSVNISVPTGFTVPDGTGVGAYAFSGKAGWALRPLSTPISSTIKIGATSSSAALSASESVTVSFTATAPSTCTPQAYTWATAVKQSNDFSGTGNDFQHVAGNTDPTTSVGAIPGPANHFTVSTNLGSSNTATAGHSFTVTITAEDSCGNTAGGYSGSATLSGNLGTVGTHTPDYNGASAVTITSGQGTGTVTAYKAPETSRTVTATDTSNSSITGTTNPGFSVKPDAAATLSWTTPADNTQQPSDTQVNTAMAPAPKVAIFDQWGNLKTDATGNVSLALNRKGTDPTSGAGTLTGGSAAPSSGVATFSNLKIDLDHTDYFFTASFGLATPEDSTTFKVVDLLANCPGDTGCHGHINNGKYSLDVTVPGGGNTGNLALSLGTGFYQSCTRLDGSTANNPDNAMGYQTVVPPSGYTLAHPITIVVVYPKSVAPGTGVANFILCKTYEETPPIANAPVPGSYEMPNCPKSGPITAACISDRRRVGAGDLQVTMMIDSRDPVPSGLKGL